MMLSSWKNVKPAVLWLNIVVNTFTQQKQTKYALPTNHIRRSKFYDLYTNQTIVLLFFTHIVIVIVIRHFNISNKILNSNKIYNDEMATGNLTASKMTFVFLTFLLKYYIAIIVSILPQWPQHHYLICTTVKKISIVL